MFKNSIQTKAVLLISLFIFLSGCAGSVYHHYSGNHLPETELATIKPWYKDTLDVFPTFIDGKETDIYRRISLPSHYVLPGEHKIKLALSTNQFRINHPKVISFQAKANHTYITKAFITKLKGTNNTITVKTSFWIEDEITKEVVGGTRITK